MPRWLVRERQPSTADHTIIGDRSFAGAGVINATPLTAAQLFITDIDGNPLLANNGGPTQTIALRADSPAVNAGSNALAVDADGNALTTDQRGTGFARISGGTVDLGAYEFVDAPPTDLALSNSSLAENAGASFVIGTLSTTDADSTDSFTYALVSGTGDDDNSLFTIAGNQLIARNSFDYETKHTFTVRVQTTDFSGQSIAKAFTITVTDVNEPIGPVSDSDSVASVLPEDTAVGATVGITALAIDGDTADTVTYSLDDDASGLFAIDQNTGIVTLAKAFDFETATSHKITVKATSSDGSSQTADFTIDVTDVDEFDVTTPVDHDATTNTVAEDLASAAPSASLPSPPTTTVRTTPSRTN